MAQKLKNKIISIIKLFEKQNPNPKSELIYNNPFELLVAVVLSAQCTDVRVNKITPNLFKKLTSPEDFAKSNENEIYELIKSCSYPNNKAKHLLNLSIKLVNNFNSKVPDNIANLQTLDGVGRKTANVILSVLFDIPALAVDTHVHRVSARIGLTKNSKTPLETEKQLLKIVPCDIISKFHHWIILHGRYICKARTPNCNACYINDLCDFYLKSH